jgi:hypothetical protein
MSGVSNFGGGGFLGGGGLSGRALCLSLRKSFFLSLTKSTTLESLTELKPTPLGKIIM